MTWFIWLFALSLVSVYKRLTLWRLSLLKFLLFETSSSHERNHGHEAFHKLVTMCTVAHVLYKRSLNQNPTNYSAVDSVCNILFNINKFFPTSRLSYAISKKEEIGNLLSSGFSPHLFVRSILTDIMNSLQNYTSIFFFYQKNSINLKLFIKAIRDRCKNSKGL